MVSFIKQFTKNNDIFIGEKFKMNGKKFIGIKLFDN